MYSKLPCFECGAEELIARVLTNLGDVAIQCQSCERDFLIEADDNFPDGDQEEDEE